MEIYLPGNLDVFVWIEPNFKPCQHSWNKLVCGFCCWCYTFHDKEKITPYLESLQFYNVLSHSNSEI